MFSANRTERIDTNNLKIAGLARITGYILLLIAFIVVSVHLFTKTTSQFDIYISIICALFTTVFCLFSLRETLKKLTMDRVEINNHAWSLENFIDFAIIRNLDEDSTKKISKTLVLEYMNGNDSRLPKNLISFICNSHGFRKIFRFEILEKLEYLTDRQKEDWFVGENKNLGEVDKLIEERRNLEDLLRLLDDTNRYQNMTDFNFANFQTSTIVPGTEPRVPTGCGVGISN